MSLDFGALVGQVDTGLLEYTEETHEGYNRARIIQGTPELEADPNLSQTVHFLGGIGFPVDSLNEEQLKKADGVSKLESGEYATFRELDIVFLASASVRRYFAEVDGKKKLACGTNQDGNGAKGWSGISCSACEYFPKNWVANGGKKKDACTASIQVLSYFPELDHTAILELRGGAYMDAVNWRSLISKLSKELAKKPEIQAAQPGLARMNSYFFKTRIRASELRAGDESKFRGMSFNEPTAPYKWEEIINSSDVIAKSKQILEDMKEAWERSFTGHNASAVFALPSADSTPQALPGSAAPLALPGGVEVVEIPAHQAAPAAAEPTIVATAMKIDDLEEASEDDAVMSF